LVFFENFRSDRRTFNGCRLRIDLHNLPFRPLIEVATGRGAIALVFSY
jgi:hypothetical protein